MDKKLKQLRALTRMALDVEMMKLQKITMDEQEKTDRIVELHMSEEKRAAMLNDSGGADLALYLGVDKRWSIWKQKRVSDLNVQKAALIASKEEQKQHTQNAFGKDQALHQIIEKNLKQLG